MSLPNKRIEQLAGLAVLGVLTLGVLIILRPFLAALVWALILSMSTWPVYQWFLAKLHGRRTVAAGLMTLLVAIALLLPLVLVGTRLAEQVAGFSGWLSLQLARGLPGPPAWLADLPLIGASMWSSWYELSADTGKLSAELQQHVGLFSKWLLPVAKTLGSGLLELTLSVLTTFFFYRDGESAARRMMLVLHRLTAGRAARLVVVAENTMIGVVYGIVGTSLAQGTLAGLGFWVAGVPGAFLLGMMTSVMSLLPFGPPVIWLPSSIWLMAGGDLTWGIFLFFWGLLVVSTVDNIIKPLFIHRGSALPLLLVLLGVFGGVIGFGFLGIFIGPTLLAIAYTLLKEWAPDEEPPLPPTAA